MSHEKHFIFSTLHTLVLLARIVETWKHNRLRETVSGRQKRYPIFYKENIPMKTKRIVALTLAAIFAITLAGEAMAATKSQTRTRTKTPTSTCIPAVPAT